MSMSETKKYQTASANCFIKWRITVEEVINAKQGEIPLRRGMFNR